MVGSRSFCFFSTKFRRKVLSASIWTFFVSLSFSSSISASSNSQLAYESLIPSGFFHNLLTKSTNLNDQNL